MDVMEHMWCSAPVDSTGAIALYSACCRTRTRFGNHFHEHDDSKPGLHGNYMRANFSDVPGSCCDLSCAQPIGIARTG